MTISSGLIQHCDQPFKRLFSYVRPYHSKFWLAINNSGINKLLDLAPPLLVGWSIDTVTGVPPKFIEALVGRDPLLSGLLLGSLAVIIFAFEGLFEYLYDKGFRSLAQRVQHRLRIDTYRKMQSREMAFFEEHRVGETMSILSDDINQLERFLNTVFNDIVQMIALFVISAFILINASPQLSLIAIMPIPVVVWGSLWFQKLLTPKYKFIREAVGSLNTRLENNLAGIAVIKSFTAENFETERLSQVSSEYRDRNLDAIQLSAIFVPMIRMGVALGFGGVLVMGAIWTIEGHITAGTFTLFGMMSQRILWPLTRLGAILDETERARASAARIFGLLDSKSAIIDRPQAKSLLTTGGAIQFSDVHFKYNRGNPILNGLTFNIAPRETIGFAGATGAGKSTLIKLILRLYEPQSGDITIDNQNIQEVTLESLRRNIALVSQDVYLFQGTIAENISYGTSMSPIGDIIAASKRAQFHEFVESLPEGYETLVGERGIKLSGGQRQRLSIARALLKNAPIMIFDEATSSVDTETERAIQRHLETYTQDKTAIIIAHRLSTIRNADRIFVLEDGRLQETGSHDELIQKNGVYADLWSLQSGKPLA